MPDVVADAMRDALTAPLSNRGVVTEAERNADTIVGAARTAMADLLGAESGGVVFGRSMTQLTYDFARTLAKSWRPGDEVVVTRLDHDANVRPWVQAAEAVGTTIRWADFDPLTGELTIDDVAAQLTDRTRLVAVTAASNLIGTRPPVGEIAKVVHAHDALLYVDGVHLTAHAPVDVAAHRRRLLRVLALQVPGAALWSPRRLAAAAGGACLRQPAPADRRCARALRARNAALRADGRHDRRRGLPGVARRR